MAAFPYDELSPEERRGRRHKDKVTLEAERQAKLAIAEAEKLKANIEAETAVITQQKEVAQKELKTAQSGSGFGFYAHHGGSEIIRAYADIACRVALAQLLQIIRIVRLHLPDGKDSY